MTARSAWKRSKEPTPQPRQRKPSPKQAALESWRRAAVDGPEEYRQFALDMVRTLEAECGA